MDPTKGIAVGTVFERAAFIPHGAYFHITSFDDKRIMLESGRGGGKPAIVNKAPKGVGSTFGLQLPPPKKKVTRWALDYGQRIKVSEGYKQTTDLVA